MKLVVLAGIPGSGSTTLLNSVLEEVDYVNINYGDEMLEIAKNKGLVEHRDEIRTLGSDTQIEIQKLAAKSIHEKAKDMNLIVDTHCTISTPNGFLPGLPEWVLRELQPTLFVLIEANPDEILLRRLDDTSRIRDAEFVKDIKLHQKMNRAAAMAYAVISGATVKIIENHNNHLASATKKLVKVL